MAGAAILRLRTVPWAALGRLAAPLAGACGEVLGGRAAERVLDALLRRHRDASADERRVAAEVVFGVGLWRRRLAWQAGAGDPLEVPPLRLIHALACDLGGLDREMGASLLGLSEVPRLRQGVPSDLAVRHSFPEWIHQVLRREVGEGEVEALAEAFNLPGPVTLRANALLLDRDGLAAELGLEGVETSPGRFAPFALHVTSPRPNILGLSSFRRGGFEVQDEGSQLLGALVQVRPGESVLDYCAGAGGKALQILGDLRGSGTLHVFDVDLSRLSRLEGRVRKASLEGRGERVLIHRVRPPASLAVDKVLVDAPCSELGALRRGPDVRFRISEASFSGLPALQLQILEEASAHVRPGGILVYGTCSIAREENEDVVARFLSGRPDFRVAPLPGWLAPELVRDGFLRTWPHRHGTDGFFGAVLRRST